MIAVSMDIGISAAVIVLAAVSTITINTAPKLTDAGSKDK
jgi:hypothetical protein